MHPSRRDDLLTPDTLQTTPATPFTQHVDAFGNLATRILAPGGPLTVHTAFTVMDSGASEPHDWDAPQRAVQDLPDEVLPYLLGSRCCETDERPGLIAVRGDCAGLPRLQAILDYAHARIAFGYAHARSTRTTWEAHAEGVGVCRDYAHLAITLCRCMNIPARYCTGYLGDIGVPPVDAPMDFSAWVEVYLGDRWHTVDARHNSRRIGRILVARGRNATDVAISTAFGPAALVDFQVVTREIDSACGRAVPMRVAAE